MRDEKTNWDEQDYWDLTEKKEFDWKARPALPRADVAQLCNECAQRDGEVQMLNMTCAQSAQ